MEKYYKCIKEDTVCFKFNKIYLCRNPNQLEDKGNFIDNNGYPNGYLPFNHLYFKLVSEMEFYQQENIKNDLIITNYSIF